MLDDDDYPPYSRNVYSGNVYRHLFPEKRHLRWSEVAVAILCGLVAGVAIGGLLVAYGVF